MIKDTDQKEMCSKISIINRKNGETGYENQRSVQQEETGAFL